jgi:hypothetical protein
MPAELPSCFGFSLAVHPYDGNTIYVIAEASNECRLVPGGAFHVYALGAAVIGR